MRELLDTCRYFYETNGYLRPFEVKQLLDLAEQLMEIR